MKKFFFILKVAVVAVAVFAAVFWFLRGLRSEVEVATVTQGVAVHAVTGTVNVFAEFEMDVRGEVGGRILESGLAIGSHVEEGEVLARIDPGDLELEIERIEIDYRAARQKNEIGSFLHYDLVNFREDLESFERRAQRGDLSQAELERQRRNLERLEEQLELERIESEQRLQGLENALKSKQRQMAKMTLRSPIDGVVTEIHSRAGDLIGGGSSLARLLAVGRVVEARVSEDAFAGVAEGQEVTVRFLTYGGELFSGNVSSILPSADPQTQRYTLHLDLEIPPERLRPGMTGEVSIVTGRREDALIVPRRAVVARHVFVVNGDQRIERREIEPGFVSLNEMEIRSGVEAGERVVVEEIDRLRDGDRVRLQ